MSSHSIASLLGLGCCLPLIAGLHDGPPTALEFDHNSTGGEMGSMFAHNKESASIIGVSIEELPNDEGKGFSQGYLDAAMEDLDRPVAQMNLEELNSTISFSAANISRLDNLELPQECLRFFDSEVCCRYGRTDLKCGDPDYTCRAAGEPAPIIEEEEVHGQVLRIVNPIPYSGLVAQLQVVMLQVIWARDRNMKVFIDLPKCNVRRLDFASQRIISGIRNAYHSEIMGRNSFDQFFEQPDKIYSLKQATDDGKRVYQLSPRRIQGLFSDNFDYDASNVDIPDESCPNGKPSGKTPNTYFIGCWSPSREHIDADPDVARLAMSSFTGRWNSFIRDWYTDRRKMGYRLMKVNDPF